MNKLLSIPIVFLSALAGASCSSSVDNMPKGEPLESYTVNEASLLFTAISNGCSQSADFVIQIEEMDQDSATIAVMRIKDDNCKRMPAMKQFSLPLVSELQSKELVVLNPQAESVKKGK